MISDPSKVEEIIRSTPADTKEKLQNMDTAFKIQQQFNIAMAVGLVVFGISLFRMSIRLDRHD